MKVSVGVRAVGLVGAQPERACQAHLHALFGACV